MTAAPPGGSGDQAHATLAKVVPSERFEELRNRVGSTVIVMDPSGVSSNPARGDGVRRRPKSAR
jgi:hypothetical protein